MWDDCNAIAKKVKVQELPSIQIPPHVRNSTAFWRHGLGTRTKPLRLAQYRIGDAVMYQQ
jgi:hypothetical protein